MGAWPASPAYATGGLDIWDGPSSTPPPVVAVPPAQSLSESVRVLLASGGGLDPRPLSGGTFEYEGKVYPGTYAIVSLPSGNRGLVTTVDLEAYVCGVVPIEAGRGWPAAALQAQAIAARTYALTRRSARRMYDVVAGSGDQNYGGASAQSPDTNAAVAATAGQILAYGDTLATVFYTSSCGGHTADAQSQWANVTLPYLRGVADPYCASAPGYRWRSTMPADAFFRALGPKFAQLGLVQAIAVAQTDDAGRATMLTVTGSAGSAAASLFDLRRALGGGMPSPFVLSVELQPGATQAAAMIAIEGAGRGHGVGMCQWGARGMAMQGHSADEILAFYFPGTIIRHG